MVMAQDVIVKKDGSTIQSKVMEINEREIKFKKWSNLEGPMYTINKNEVNSINYQNGEVELIAVGSPNNSSQTTFNDFGTNERMERDGKNLTLNGRELSDEEVLLLVGKDNYETYISARKQITIGRVFTPIFYASAGLTILFSITAAVNDYNLIYAALATGTIMEVSLPMMLVFKSAGKGRLNWVANEYNRNVDSSTISYQLSPSIMKCNPMVSQNNLGLGLTFSLNF